MPRPRPSHFHREITRHGKAMWYVRIGKGPRIRVRAESARQNSTPNIRAAFTSQPRRMRGPAERNARVAVARYREAAEWRALSPATQRQRENIFMHVIETAGDKPVAKITTATIIAGRERRASNPAQARNFLDAMRGLFRWAAKGWPGQAQPDDRSDQSADQKRPRFTCVDGRSRCGVRAAVAARHPPKGLARRPALQRASAGRRRQVGRQHVRDGVGTIRPKRAASRWR